MGAGVGTTWAIVGQIRCGGGLRVFPYMPHIWAGYGGVVGQPGRLGCVRESSWVAYFGLGRPPGRLGRIRGVRLCSSTYWFGLWTLVCSVDLDGP